MKRVFVILGILMVTLLSMMAGLSCSEDIKLTAILGSEFTLSVGQTALIEGEGLTLKFVEVEQDSRCAKGVECIVAGQVTCKVHVNYKGATSDISMTQVGGSLISFGSLGDYNVGFRVEPYPEAGKPIAESEYKLIMKIQK